MKLGNQVRVWPEAQTSCDSVSVSFGIYGCPSPSWGQESFSFDVPGLSYYGSAKLGQVQLLQHLNVSFGNSEQSKGGSVALPKLRTL